MRAALTLAALLGAAGITHFAKPEPYDAIVPRSLPGPARAYTYASGACELALAAGLAHPRTRRAAGLAAAGFFVAVFPANVRMAVDWRHASPAKRAIAWGRLPLQVPLVWWALRAARRGWIGGRS
ncbi:DoxX family protein [Dactylosporangium sp. CS-047395]|uniref:DoxX family protein n=1 Tax=Dactylosporangium sp. CS-047395 TaxID=3239936 RepID=UPI003D9478C0